MQQILLVEDDVHQLQLIQNSLAEQNPTRKIHSFSKLEEAKNYLKTNNPDLVLSDIILGKNKNGGFELAQLLQEKTTPTPLIFFSERQTEFDILTGHNLGAIDYLAKPINLQVLQKKLDNLLNITRKTSSKTTGYIADLKLDLTNFTASWKNQTLNLTLTELEMLQQFSAQPLGSLISYEQLETATQGVVERSTINTHICHLRNAFKKLDAEFDSLHNVYGKGYAWR